MEMSPALVLQQCQFLSSEVQQCSYLLLEVQQCRFLSPAVQAELVKNSSGTVTPRKVRGIQETLRQEKDLYRCALKVVPILFTKTELANSNTDGSHRKGSLDSGRLNSLKTLIFTQFPVTSNEEKETNLESYKRQDQQ